MLETRNLRKVYRPKKGVPVVALDGITLKFPERGMVFLLGKSGSGKSTLLNLLGGLDKYDDGEIIIKGVSSRDFNQERFDSYRNTYVGFIFQDYNVLPEFTVGANIALALELQGKKATDEQINKILDEVDLAGYGNRRPNELSGGQLQRVAIARALVKNPEIIMADEPTGALDSATGKQVFDTLKKLSTQKLVIIVSHDREYAEFYADRIIELADGHVISDVEYSREGVDESDAISYDGDTVNIPAGYHLTEEDRREINEYIDRLRAGTRLHFSGLSKRFLPTDTSKIPPADPSKFSLIKSRLPLHSAFRIGASGLKYKKFRLVMTILLSVVAFGLFALADTFGAYNHIEACTNSLLESNVRYLSLVKAKQYTRYDGTTAYTTGSMLDDDDISSINRDMGTPVSGVFVPLNGIPEFDQMIDSESEQYTERAAVLARSFSGYSELDEKTLSDLGYTLAAGRIPAPGKNELAITSYVLETFKTGGFATGETKKSPEGMEVPVYDKISSPEDMLGRKWRIGEREFEIVGVVDTKLDLTRYDPLLHSEMDPTMTEQLERLVLSQELEYAQIYSFHCLAFVGDGMIKTLLEDEPDEIPFSNSRLSLYAELTDNSSFELYPDFAGKFADMPKDANIVWADGKARDSLGEGEIIVSPSLVNYYKSTVSGDTIYMTSIELTKEDYDLLFGSKFTANLWSFGGADDDTFENWHVVGILENVDEDSVSSWSIYMSDNDFERTIGSDYGDYTFAVGTMPKAKNEIRKIAELTNRTDTEYRYEMKNPVIYELDGLNSMLEVLSKVFLWIGVGFAVFASIMLANFIGTSIAYKKQEIGILRAIGSRSSDVFNIFFAEGFIIAVINFILASLGTLTATLMINYYLRIGAGILVTVISFGIRQVALLIVISLGVAALSCFLPVKRIASKRPIDAIRGR